MQTELRKLPYALKVMEALETRTKLAARDRQYLANVQKGYAGECEFDSILEKHISEGVILKDCLFKVSGTTFQIDTIWIKGALIRLYEVKNYEGEYQLDGNRLYKVSTGAEVLNPSLQSQRAAVLFQQLLREIGLEPISIEAYVVYINESLTLYMNKPDAKIVQRSQLKHHLLKVGKQESKVKIPSQKIRSAVNAHRLITSAYQDLPTYTWESLQKGAYCRDCRSYRFSLVGRIGYCLNCGYKEGAQANAVRHIEEYRLLFTERPLSTRDLSVWCGGLHSYYRLRKARAKVLQDNSTEL